MPYATDGELDHDTDSAWEAFARGLVTYLQMMAEADDDQDHLIVALLSGGAEEATPYAQFCVQSPGVIRAEVPGNSVLAPAYRLADSQISRLMAEGGWDPPTDDGPCPNFSTSAPVDELESLAARVRVALEQFYGVPHPSLLCADAWGPVAIAVDVLGIPTVGGLPADVVDEASRPVEYVVMPTDREELVEAVRECLRHHLKFEPQQNADEDFVIPNDYGSIWVRVRQDHPFVMLVGRVVHQVRSRSQAAIEANLLNRDVPLMTYVAVERDILQVLQIPAAPFSPAQLTAMIPLFKAALAEVRGDLSLRTGGARG